MKTGTWYRVILPYACCALVVEGSKVVDAAPIMRWAIGKEAKEVGKWIRSKGGSVSRLEG